jgi:hypothetical protein
MSTTTRLIKSATIVAVAVPMTVTMAPISGFPIWKCNEEALRSELQPPDGLSAYEMA